MKAMIDILRVLLDVAIPLASFATGLGVGKPGPDTLWRHPAQLARALLAILIVVPLWAFLLLQMLPLSPIARTGLAISVLAVGIGPVAGMKRLQGETARRAFELNVTVLLAAIVYVPLMVSFLAHAYSRHVTVGMAMVAKIVFGRALIPLLIGMWVARRSPAFSSKLRRPIGIGLNLTLALVLVVVLIALWRGLVAVGVSGWLTCFAIAGGAAVIGHLLGGPAAETRGPVAAASAMRFPALALLLAMALPEGKRLAPVVAAYALAALIVVAIYGRVTQRHTRTARRTAVMGHATS
jgi:BASS family bile acid:Na+ symporter